MRRILTKISRRLFPPTVVIEGYEAPELVDAIVRKTKAYVPSAHLDIGDARTVLDFGGGSGRHYKEASPAHARWAVVETSAMVAQARALETERLRFFETIDEATSWLGPVDLMHSNGAIQYTDDPMRFVESLVAVRAKEMRWFRLHLSDNPAEDSQTSFLNDNGPGALSVDEKLVRYRRRAITEREFLLAHAPYSLVETGPDWFVFKS